MIQNSGARFLLAALGLLGLLGCEPTFDDRNSQVVGTRVLAVKVTPAQAKPGVQVTLRALVVEPTGTLRESSLDWAFCNAPKPVAETNDVSSQCLAAKGEQFQELGRGPSAKGLLPKDACRLFGPDVPPVMAGESAGRPTDPDSTGSFYQPVRILLQSEPAPVLALGQASLICGLPTLTGEQLLDYQKRFRANEHPAIVNVQVGDDTGEPLSVDDGATPPLQAKKGQKLTLHLTWPECPATSTCGDGVCSEDETTDGCPGDCMMPVGCRGAETYVYYDPLARVLVDRREAMRVAWFAGAGSFTDDHTGRREDEVETFSNGEWTAPSEAGPVHIWAVLRDSRGGVDWQSYVVNVQ